MGKNFILIELEEAELHHGVGDTEDIARGISELLRATAGPGIQVTAMSEDELEDRFEKEKGDRHGHH